MDGRFLSKCRVYVVLSIVICAVLLTVNAFAKTPGVYPEITARAAVIMDGDKVLYAKNPTMKQPPASTTKLVTAMVVLDRMNPNDIVTISGNAAKLHGAHVALREGERFYVKDLLSLLLMKSVNGAALALAEAVSGDEKDFVMLMNEKALSLGATNTRFINSHGLPGEGQYITAYDLAAIMKKSLEYCLIKETINTKTKKIASLEGRQFTLANTNKLLWSDDDLVGGKTGYTREARHCLAFAAEKGENTLVAALLGDGRRSDLWKSARFVLSKGQDISSTHAKPVIYYSNIADEKEIKTAKKSSRTGTVKKYGRKKHRVERDKRIDAIAASYMDAENGDAQQTIAKKSSAKKKLKKSRIHTLKGTTKSKALARKAATGQHNNAKKDAPCRTAYKGGKTKNCTADGSSIPQIYKAVSADNAVRFYN
ncbi:MAG: D-alanyl-D-alanine carboxypeptidase [Nitrospirae bacterium]|nr:D-alanyl-D-alanine carboxypeptidase [Nitrospirota bacterium]